MTSKVLGLVADYAVPALAFVLVIMGITDERVSSIVVGFGVLTIFSIRESTRRIIAAIRETRPTA